MKAMLAAQMLMRMTPLVGLVLMRVLDQMTVKVRTQLRLRVWM